MEGDAPVEEPNEPSQHIQSSSEEAAYYDEEYEPTNWFGNPDCGPTPFVEAPEN